MDINRNNYEAFLLDLLEGRLSVEKEQELNEFLEKHPEHVVDMPDQDLWSLKKDRVSFPSREQLKKNFPTPETCLSDANFDLFSIARMEGDLSSSQVEEHRSMVDQDRTWQEEWHAWQKTRLVPEQMRFPGKKAMKHRTAVSGRNILFVVLSAAATLTLLFLVLRMNPQLIGPGLSEIIEEEIPSNQELSVQEPSVQEPSVQEPSVQDLRQGEPSIVTEGASKVRKDDLSLANIEKAPGEMTQETPGASLEESSRERIEETASEVHEGSQVESYLRESNAISGNPELLKPRPVRMADQQIIKTGQLNLTRTDQIERLPVSPVSPKLASLSVKQLAEMDRKDLVGEITEEYNISLMSVANAGIKGINKMTGSDISLLASRDDEGDVSGFRLKSKRFSVTRPLGNGE